MRRHSHYNYTFNNPIRFIDPDGRAPKTDFTFNIETGQVRQVGETNNEPDRILKTNKDGSIATNKKGEAKEKLATVADGVKELMNNAFMAMDIPAAIKSTDDHVKAAKDINMVEGNAKFMGQAIGLVDNSGIKMNRQTRNDVINYVYDGTLSTKGLMPNSSIIQNGNTILKANKLPIRPTQDQIKKMLNDKQKQIEKNLRNIPQ